MNLIGGLTFNNSVQDFGTSPALNGAYDVVTQDINGVTFVYVAGYNDNGIQVLSMADSGLLTPETSISDTSALGLSRVALLETVQVGSEFFLISASQSDYAVDVFRIDDDGQGTDGQLIPVDTYFNNPGGVQSTEGQGLLSFPTDLEAHVIGGVTYVAVSAYFTNSVTIFAMANDGQLTRTDSAVDADDPSYFLNGASSSEFHDIGNKTFLFVSAYNSDDGISVFEVSASGILTNVDNIAAPASSQILETHAFNHNGTDYLVALDNNGTNLHVYEIAASGALTFKTSTPNFIDGTSYSGMKSLESFVVEGVPYLVVSASSQDTLLVLTLDENEDIQIVQAITDTSFLNNVTGVEMKMMGDRVFLLAAATDTDRISVFEIGGLDDAVVGSAEADRITGLNDDDELLGRNGDDELFGMNGDDLLSGQKGDDTLFGGAGEDVLIGGNANDLLEGGADGDILKGGFGTDMLSYESSASAVQVDLGLRTASKGDAEGDLFIGFENLRGSNFNDILDGDDARNTIEGLFGNDRIDGGGGRDKIFGGGGRDSIEGGDADDTIFGDNGADTLEGGEGNDKLVGGAVDDVLIGGAGDDEISGGKQRDTITGGAGDDTLSGNNGADTFVFAAGFDNDVVSDFDTNADVLDFTAFTGIASTDDFDVFFTFGGDTLIQLEGGASSIVLTGVDSASLDADNFTFFPEI